MTVIPFSGFETFFPVKVSTGMGFMIGLREIIVCGHHGSNGWLGSGLVQESEHGAVELVGLLYVWGVSRFRDYCKPSVWQFVAHVFRNGFEFTVVSAYDAEHWDFDVWKQFVERWLSAWVSGTQRVRKSDWVASEPLFSDLFSDGAR